MNIYRMRRDLGSRITLSAAEAVALRDHGAVNCLRKITPAPALSGGKPKTYIYREQGICDKIGITYKDDSGRDVRRGCRWAGMAAGKVWICEPWWDRDLSAPSSRVDHTITGFVADGPPSLPAFVRRGIMMPLWASRFRGVVSDVDTVISDGVWHWSFTVTRTEIVEVRIDDGTKDTATGRGHPASAQPATADGGAPQQQARRVAWFDPGAGGAGCRGGAGGVGSAAQDQGNRGNVPRKKPGTLLGRRPRKPHQE